MAEIEAVPSKMFGEAFRNNRDETWGVNHGAIGTGLRSSNWQASVLGLLQHDAMAEAGAEAIRVERISAAQATAAPRAMAWLRNRRSIAVDG